MHPASILARLPAELVASIGLGPSGIHLTTGHLGPAWGFEVGVTRLVLWAGAYVRRKPPPFEDLLSLLEHPALDGVEQLAIFGMTHQAGHLARLLDTRLATRARFLCLHSVPIDARAIERLRVPPLADLDVMWGPSPADAAALAKITGLRRLRIANGRFGPAGLQALAATQLFEVVDGHSFVDSALGDEGAGLLATLAPRFRGGVLDLAHAQITDVGLRALFDAAWAQPVTELRLWDTAVTDAAVEALVRSPLGAQLEGLVLDRSGVSRETVRALLSGLPSLRRLQATHELDRADLPPHVSYTGPLRAAVRPAPRPAPLPAPPAAPTWKVADRVTHGKFGGGDVVALHDDRAEVRFDDGSHRTLLLRVLSRP